MSTPVVYRKPSGAIGAILPQALIENLVFEGGGPKGLVYLGAIEVLEAKGIMPSVRNVGGSSAGAMTALAVGLGLSAAETRTIVEKQSIGDLTDLAEKDDLGLPAKVIQALKNLFGTSDERGRGVFLGEKLLAWIQNMIGERVKAARPHVERQGPEAIAFWTELDNKHGAITFAELAKLAEMAPALNIRQVVFTGTNYTDRCIEVFSAIDSPDMPVALAVRISSSLPWFFKSVKYQGKEYIDGGCLENFPMWAFDGETYRADNHRKILRGAFDQNLATLGFKVDSAEEIRRILWEGAKADETSGLAKIWADIKAKLADKFAGVDITAAGQATDKAVYGKYAQRTIQIPDLDYSTFKFDLDETDKAKLRKSGTDATTEWFSLYFDDMGIELEIHGLSELADYLTPANFAAVCRAYPQFADPQAKGETVMSEDTTPFDPSQDIYNGISVLSTQDWVDLTTFFETSAHDNPTTTALMRMSLGMRTEDEFRPEFSDAVGLFADLKKCGEMFKTEVEGKMLTLADDIVHYNDASAATYERLIELVDRFDFDGAPDGATTDIREKKWLALVGAWESNTVQGRSVQIKQRFSSALEQLITDANDRAKRADDLQLAILAPNGILARLNTSKAAFAAERERFNTVLGVEGVLMKKIQADIDILNHELERLRKKEKDEVIVLSTAPLYLLIPFFGPMVMAGVLVGVGIDLDFTRKHIAEKLGEILKQTDLLGTNQRFMAYYTSTNNRFDAVGKSITDLGPKLETLGKAWRAIASDLGNVHKVLSTDGRVSIRGENWFNLTIALTNAMKGWARIATQADHFRKFGGPPAKAKTTEEFVAGVTQKIA